MLNTEHFSRRINAYIAFSLTSKRFYRRIQRKSVDVLLAWFLYEYMITLGHEINLYWRTRLTGGSVLFFANRYIQLLLAVLPLITYAPPDLFTPKVCVTPLC